MNTAHMQTIAGQTFSADVQARFDRELAK